MPIVYTIDPELPLISAKMMGPVTFAEVEAYQAHLLADPDYRPEYNTLTDMREMTTVLTVDELRRIAARKSPRMPALFGSRRAIVADRDGAFGMMRMLQGLTGGAESPFRVFRTIDEACAWLELPQVAAGYLRAGGNTARIASR